jgi:hypothetical protein
MAEFYSDINANGNRVTNVGTPVSPNDAITEAYASANYAPIAAVSGSFLLRNSGRIYLYADLRWIAIHDDLYGSNYYQYDENAGTGVGPILEWEHNGVLIPSGYRLKRFFLLGRSNNTQVTNLQVCIKEVKPNPITRYATGINADAEVVDDIIFDGLFTDMVFNATGQVFSNSFADKHMGIGDVNHDFVDTSELRLYIKPVGALTLTRYFYATWTFEFEKI